MWRKHKLAPRIVSLLVLFSTFLSLAGGALLPHHASAASGVPPAGNFSFQAVTNFNGLVVPLASMQIVSDDSNFNTGLLLAGPLDYVAGSKYKFADIGITITVDPKTPGKGQYVSGDYKQTIDIGNFDMFVQAAKSNLDSSGSITAKLSLNFGSADSTLSIGSASVTAVCADHTSTPQCQNLLPLGTAADPSPATLTSNTVKYSQLMQNLIVGQNYKVCFTADYIKNAPLCKNVVATKAGATVSITGNGDASKLSKADGSGGGGGSNNTIDCDFDGNPLTWFVCPVVDGMVSLINKADAFITSALLYDNTDAASSVFSNGSYYAAWSSIRVLATAIIVIAGLVMVASQALGFEILDAYTVRKVLPRLLVAIIGISLSWPLMSFMVHFFNNLGVDLRNIIYAPFGDISQSLGGGALTAGLTGLLLTGVFLGIIGALSFGLTALLAILTGFAIIVFRDIALTFIIVLAPIGIAGYILPNTQKLWKLWADNFLGLLLMFPIIEGFIAIGHAFAAVALGPQSANTGAFTSSTLAQIIGFCAYFAPYFLLPVAFKLATGAIGSIAGVMAGHGLGERLKKFRGSEVARNTRDLKAGSRFNPESRITKALGGNMVNRVGSNVGAGVRGRFGFGATGAAMRANNASLTMDAAAKENSRFAAQMNNEGAMAALAFGNNERKLRQLQHYQKADGTGVDEEKLKADMAAARSVGVDRRTQVAAAEALAKSGKVLANREEAESLYDTVGGGNQALRGAVKGNYQFTSRQVGRADIGRDNDQASLKELNVSDISRQKPKSLQNLLGGGAADGSTMANPAATPIIQAMSESVNNGNYAEAAHYADILHAAKSSPYTSPEQQEHIQKAIDYANGMRDSQGNSLRIMDGAAQRAQEKMGRGDNDIDPSTGGLRGLGG